MAAWSQPRTGAISRATCSAASSAAVGRLEGDVGAAREHVVDVERPLVQCGVADFGGQVLLGPDEGIGQAWIVDRQIQQDRASVP